MGVWDQIRAALPNTSQPVWTAPLVPPFRVQGRVDPRMMTGDIQAEEVSGETGIPGPLKCRWGP